MGDYQALRAEVSSLEDEVHDMESRLPPSEDDKKLVKQRRARLRWHIFWLTLGMILGVAVTYTTDGLWLHIAILTSGVPAYAQEVTDFVKAW